MFVRIRNQQVKDHSFSYAYLVENRWNAIRKKHEQKIVASLGRLDTLPVDGTIEKMIGALDRFAASMGIASLSNGIILSDLSDERVLSKVKEWGSLLLTRAIMQQLSLVGILEGAYGKAEKKKTKNRDLFNGKLDLVLFDTTSIYYWGAQGPSNEKDLLQYGFSKDGKGNLKQLIVGVLMTSDGVPIAHEVFPGNTADVNSFSRIVTVLKEKYSIDKVILIADRGMVSEENIVSLEQSGLSYILGIRMRQLPASLKQKLLVPLDEEEERYELDFMDKSADNLCVKEFPVSKFSYNEINDLFIEKIKKGKSATFNGEAIIEAVKKRRFFVCLNPFVQAGTKKKREFFTKIIERKIRTTPTKEWIIKNGYKKYLKFEKGLSPSIDYDRLPDEEVYDGKWVIMTNEKNISSYSAGTYYKSLQTIERGFRDLKSLITVQPIFHWTERRIRAHVFTCFLSLVSKWYICRMLNQYSQEEGRRFIGEMIDLKAIAVDASIPLYVRTAISPQTQENMKKLSMKIPGRIILDGRQKSVTPNPKGGRPKKVNPNQYKLPISA